MAATIAYDAGASTEATAGTTERVWDVPLDPQLQAMRDQRERDNVPPLYSMSLADALNCSAMRMQPEPSFTDFSNSRRSFSHGTRDTP